MVILSNLLIFPSSKIKALLHKYLITLTSWEIIIVVKLNFKDNSFNKLRISIVVLSSNCDVGSSHSNILGLVINALAILTLWASPPERLLGYLL